MTRSKMTRRNAKRGGVLAMAMLFFVMVTVAGTAILSMSSIQKLRTVRNGIDVRLMIAAEGAIETVRGRFTLVKGVQDDWTWVSSGTWTSLGIVNVNGINVEVEALRDPSNSVPRCRLRARAAASGVTRVVEITVRVASFSDYSVYAGGGTFGQNYKLVGNYFANGGISVPYTGARVYGSTSYVTSLSITSGETQATIFPNENPVQEVFPGFPTDATEWDYMKDVAETTGFVFAENTLEIVFSGTSFTRYYVRRRTNAPAGVGTVPTGQINNTVTSWINPTNGVTNYTSTYLNNTDYELASEFITIPDEGVIYIQSGAASGITTGGPLQPNPGDRVAGTAPNGFTQQFTLNSITSSNAFGSPYGLVSPYHYDVNIFTNNNAGYGYATGYTPILLMSGVIDDSRVTLACDHRIIVKDCIAYQGNLDNPDNRRFFNDGLNGKQGPLAVDMKEMLGVMSKSEIHPTPTWWNPLAAGDRVTGDITVPLETIPGHDHTDLKSNGADYCMDGVYLAWGSTAPRRNYMFPPTACPLGEMWYCGGLITQGDYGGGNGNTFQRRNYDWDYRMNITMPPYFLRTYLVTARFVPGTWRTWEE